MLMRYTLIDDSGAISFRAPGHALKMLAAACSVGVNSNRDVLDQLDGLDAVLADAIRNGLSRFDEHCLATEPATIDQWLNAQDSRSCDPFRVFNQAMRRASLEPEALGIVIFNLHDRRIIQVQNSYGALLRSDRGRIRHESRPTRRYYRYDLPDDWTIVP